MGAIDKWQALVFTTVVVILGIAVAAGPIYLSIRVCQVFTVSDALRRTPKVTRIAFAAVDRGWVHSDRMLDGGTVRLALTDRRVPSIPDITNTEGSVDGCVE